MFLADSLNQKLKTSLDKYGLSKTDDCLFPYKKPKSNPALLAELQHKPPEFTHEQLREMTKEDYLNKFTLKRLEKKWERKFRLNYDLSNNKFSDDYKFQKVKEARAYIKDFLDRDIFEKKLPKWDISTKVDSVIKSKNLILKNATYDANHALINYRFPPRTLSKTNSGFFQKMDSYWNISSKFEQKEKNELTKELDKKSLNNTQKYWMKNDYRRKNELEYPLSSDRRQIEEPKYFKVYKSPKELVEYNYELMKKAKGDLWHLREKLLKEEKKNNPNLCQEKIHYLVEKRMSPKYRERLDFLEKKKDLNITEITKNKKTHWQDKELIDRMKLLEELNYAKWFQMDKIYNSELFKKEIFKKLVRSKDKILKEQEKIKEEEEYERFQRMKREELESKKSGGYKKSPLHFSKYPINKQIYDLTKKAKSEATTLLIDEDVENLFDNSNDYNSINYNSDDNGTTAKAKNIREKRLFLEAYKRILLKNKIEEEEKRKNRTMSCKSVKNRLYDIVYIHPGVYRKFDYDLKIGKRKLKEEKYWAWSCCSVTDKKAKGCQRTIIKKERNFGFP